MYTCAFLQEVRFHCGACLIRRHSLVYIHVCIDVHFQLSLDEIRHNWSVSACSCQSGRNVTCFSPGDVISGCVCFRHICLRPWTDHHGRKHLHDPASWHWLTATDIINNTVLSPLIRDFCEMFYNRPNLFQCTYACSSSEMYGNI